MLSKSDRFKAKYKLKQRIKAEGRWKQFVFDREKFRRAKNIPTWVAAIALSLNDYKPLDPNTTPEYGIDDFEDVMRTVVGRPLDGGESPSPEQQQQIRVAVAGTINKGIRGAKEDAAWDRLRRKVYRVQSLGRGRRSSDETSVVRWCFENADTPVDDIDPFDVPGAGSIKLLRHIQTDIKAYDDFVRNFYTKLLAKGLESSIAGGPGDDGRTQLRVMDRLDEIDDGDDEETIARKLTPGVSDEDLEDEDLFDDIDFEEEISRFDAGPQGAASEPSVPPEGVGGGESV